MVKISYKKKFRPAVPIPTISNQYHAKTIWKCTTNHMVLDIWFHDHTWNHCLTITSVLNKKMKKNNELLTLWSMIYIIVCTTVYIGYGRYISTAISYIVRKYIHQSRTLHNTWIFTICFYYSLICAPNEYTFIVIVLTLETNICYCICCYIPMNIRLPLLFLFQQWIFISYSSFSEWWIFLFVYINDFGTNPNTMPSREPSTSIGLNALEFGLPSPLYRRTAKG
jgi:hypothetical protein